MAERAADCGRGDAGGWHEAVGATAFGRARVALTLACWILAPLLTEGCVPSPATGTLAPTLSLVDVQDSSVAMQDGIPVPSFGYQPRPRLDLSGTWRVQRLTLDTPLSLADRATSLPAIEREAGGRQLAGYDDRGWGSVDVPGSFDPPPDRSGGGAWYRRSFVVPAGWAGRAITLKFAAVNYVADVWLDGRWLGYHEGGATPFAFPIERIACVGATHVLALRVDVPVWGTRMDVVPWGLADWWNFGGIVQPAWIEASAPVAAARADVVPETGGAHVSVVVQNRGAATAGGEVQISILPAALDTANLLDPDPRALVPVGATPVAARGLTTGPLAPGALRVLSIDLPIAAPIRWRIGAPALYVARVTVTAGGAADELIESFGLRQIAVDPAAPRLLVNGTPTTLAGVALPDQELILGTDGTPVSARPLATAAPALAALRRARQVGATLLRTGHMPAEPAVLVLADRLGLAVWEELPLSHYPSLALTIAMGRGIAQQMLQEMVLRDMNHPSVMFYGLTNESTGGAVQADVLERLRGVLQVLDPSRLVGQADYAFDPAASTSGPLDVAGFTFYHGVFYGAEPGGGTRDALVAAHRRFPERPIAILEFGAWADPPNGLARQVRIMSETGGQLAARATNHDGGYVSAMVWWTLDDYFTMQPSLAIERFGLFEPDGSPRPVAAAAASLFRSVTRPSDLPAPDDRAIAAQVAPAGSSSYADVSLLLGYVAFALGFATLVLFGALMLAIRAGDPAAARHGLAAGPFPGRRR